MYLLIFQRDFFMCYHCCIDGWIELNGIQFNSVYLNVIFAWPAAWKWERKKKHWNFGSQLIDKLRFFLQIAVHFFLMIQHCWLVRVSECVFFTNIKPAAITIWMDQVPYSITFNLFHLHIATCYISNKHGPLYPLFVSQHRIFFTILNVQNWKI